MIAYFKTLLPNHTPPGITAADRMAVLQERILQWMLLILLALGSVGFAGTTLVSVRAGNWQNVILAAVLYGGGIAITVLRSQPYSLRASLLLAILFVLDVQILLSGGMTTGALPFFFALIFLSGLFFGLKPAAGVLGLGMVAGLASVLTPGSPWKNLFDPVFSGRSSMEIIVTLAAFVSVGMVVIASVLLINRELARVVRSEIQAREQLVRERESLDARIQEHNKDYQRRLREYLLAAEISRSVSSILDPDQLLQQAVDLLQERFNLYYAGIFVLDQERRFAVLKAGSGEAGKKMIAAGHRLPIGSTSMIGWAVIHGEARVALDVGAEAVRFNNPILPFTRSEMALPLQSHGEVLGALTIQSNQPNAFKEDDVLVLQGIADGLTVALENARLYRQAQDMLEEVKLMNREYLEKAWSETLRLSGGLQFSYENAGYNSDPDSEMALHQFPLLLRDQVIGYISFESEQPQLSTEEKAFIEAVTSQTAVALENARLLEESQRHAYEEQKLNEITEQFSQANSVDDILRIAVRELGELPSAAEVSIHLIPPEDGRVSAGDNGNNGHSKEILS